MLKLEKVNKYFNRFKKNQIHVINNTSLSFDKTGLVALLGPSGCGKTTLLNAIGGLDKVNSGHIYINGKKLSKVSTARKDKMRVLNVGYIFQEYNLLENLTVFENVALSLKMIGLKNKKEIESRVYYVLEKVGMYRYRNKLAGNLSGGEKQRVGIARAIVKNPSIIIADEPTGNLDSKNTIEVMNIIKAISKDKLVILVTHEKDLAHFYSSRIINIVDGKIISDNINEHENELDYKIDNKIYLKDFKNHENIDNTYQNIDFYYNDEEKIDLDIVVKNGNIYIKSNNLNKIELVNEYSSIELIDDHYKKISKEDYEKSNFDLTKLDNSKFRLHYSSIYNVFSMLKTGLKKVFNYTIIKKMLLVGFFLSAMFIVYAISNIFGVINIKESSFVLYNKDYIQVKNKQNNLEDFIKLEKDENIDYIIPGLSLIDSQVVLDDIYQLKDGPILSFSVSLINTIDSFNLIYGRMPQNENEVIIDFMTIDNILKDYDEGPAYKIVGIKSYEDFIGLEFKVGKHLKYKIVGVSDMGAPNMYFNKNHFINLISEAWNMDNEYIVNNYEFYKDEIILKQGNLPINDYDIIVNINEKETYPLNKTIDQKIGDNKLKVVGYYYSNRGRTDFLTNENTVKYETILKISNMTIYSRDKENTLSYLKGIGYNAIDGYNESKTEYIEEAKSSIIKSLITAGILLAISIIEIFLMIRASFLSRVKEVGIYRAIGVKKRDIYKMFLGEILVITTIAGVPGFILMSAMLKEITSVSFFEGTFVMNSNVIIISIILIYGLNIIIGLLPIRSTIKKTPAQILSRNDVN